MKVPAIVLNNDRNSCSVSFARHRDCEPGTPELLSEELKRLDCGLSFGAREFIGGVQFRASLLENRGKTIPLGVVDASEIVHSGCANISEIVDLGINKGFTRAKRIAPFLLMRELLRQRRDGVRRILFVPIVFVVHAQDPHLDELVLVTLERVARGSYLFSIGVQRFHPNEMTRLGFSNPNQFADFVFGISPTNQLEQEIE